GRYFAKDSLWCVGRCAAQAAAAAAQSRQARALRLLVPEVGGQEHLVDLQHVGTTKHLLRCAVLVGLGERRALGPSLEVLKATPPGLHLVVTLALGVGHEATLLVVELHRARAVHFIAHEAWRLIDEVHALAEAIFKVCFVAFGDGDAVRDDDHRCILPGAPTSLEPLLGRPTLLPQREPPLLGARTKPIDALESPSLPSLTRYPSAMSEASAPSYDTLSVRRDGHVAIVALEKPPMPPRMSRDV